MFVFVVVFLFLFFFSLFFSFVFFCFFLEPERASANTAEVTRQQCGVFFAWMPANGLTSPSVDLWRQSRQRMWMGISSVYTSGLLSLRLTLFDIFLERIMTDALENHEGNVRIGGKTVNNLRFADDIDGLAEAQELANLVDCLDETSAAYSMQISVENTKLMTNNTHGISTEVKVVRTYICFKQ